MPLLPNFPAVLEAQTQQKKLSEQYEELWKSKYEEINERLVDAACARLREAIEELKICIAALIKTKEKLAKLYEGLKIAKTPVNSDNYDATLLNYEVSSMLAKREQIKTSLQQLNFESRATFFA